ncbi:MAG: hypothetical protein R3D26_18130 [Cyanobacteriota/Melainabacteria group bacterium]
MMNSVPATSASPRTINKLQLQTRDHRIRDGTNMPRSIKAWSRVIFA